MNNKKILIIIIIILGITTISMGSYIVYNEINNKNNDEIKNNNQEKIYTLVNSNTIGNISKESYQEKIEIVDNEGNIKFTYPQINLKGNEIESLNKKIEDNIKKKINDINNTENSFTIGYEITLKETHQVKRLIHLNYYRYEVEENETNLIIKQYNVSLTEWATGYDYLEKEYIINKTDKTIEEKTYELTTLEDTETEIEFSKIDEAKEWIHDADYNLPTNKESYYPQNYENKIIKASDLIVPYINMNSKDAKKVNQEIYILYKDLINRFNLNLKEEIWFTTVTYKTYTNGNIISIIITTETAGTAPAIYEYYTYNFDLNNGKLLNYYDILSKLGYNKEQTITKTQDLLKNKMDELWGKHIDDLTTACQFMGEPKNCYEIAIDMYKESIENNNLQFYINEKGVLTLFLIPYYDGVQNGESAYYPIEIK